MVLRFEIYKDGAKLSQYTPVSAMAVASESIPVRGDVSFKDGLLRVATSDQATGVALLWQFDNGDEYVIETTRLMPRNAPYVLNVELARHRLMRLLQKTEDWGLLEFAGAQSIVERMRMLQAKFAVAVAELADVSASTKIADQVLVDTIALGDELSLMQADLVLSKRRQNNSFARYVFGSRVDWTIRSQRAKDILSDNFDYAVLPLTWRILQPKEDEFDTAALDEWMEYLSKKRIPVIAGPVIELTEQALPDWAVIWENDFDVLRDLMIDFVRKMITRYRKLVSVWNICGGLHHPSIPGLRFEQSIELTRLLVAQVKSMVSQGRTLVSISDPFGVHHAGPNSGVPPMLYAETIAQAGVNVDGFGIEMDFGVPSTGCYTRDLFQISCVLDKLSATGKPVYVTAVSAPSRSTPDGSDASEGKLDPSKGGRWNGAWTPALQATWFEKVAKIAMGKTFVESVTWGNLSDINASVPGGGLFDDMYKPKPVFDSLQKLRATLCRKK